jgi:hypothetical protein
MPSKQRRALCSDAMSGGGVAPIKVLRSWPTQGPTWCARMLSSTSGTSASRVRFSSAR